MFTVLAWRAEGKGRICTRADSSMQAGNKALWYNEIESRKPFKREDDMTEKRLEDMAQEFRKSIDEVLKELGDISDEIPPELIAARSRINKLEGAMKKQKTMLEKFFKVQQ
jgi:hypothetical protein